MPVGPARKTRREGRLGIPGRPSLSAPAAMPVVSGPRLSVWRWPEALRAGSAAAAGLFVACFLGVAFLRLGHPYELEWMAGAFADHLDRVLAGQKIYVEPTTEFVPFLYTPLYFYVSAALATLVGEGFVPLRLTSIGATLVTGALVFTLIRRTSGDRLAAWVGCGLFAATYGLIGTWFDTARADSLFVCLLTASLTVLWLGRSMGSAVAAALLLVLAYMSKQTALMLALPLAVAAGIRDLRRAAAFGIVFALVLGVSVWVLDALHGGWFSYYTWTLPRRHEYILPPLWEFWIEDLLPLYPALAAAAWLMIRLHRTGRVREMLSTGAWGAGFLLASCSSRMHVGGAENTLMPAFLGVAMLAGLALAESVKAHTPRPARLLVPATVLAQLALLVYAPWPYVPTAADRAAGDRVVRLLGETEGRVLVPLHGYLAKLAGKKGSAHAAAVLDVIRNNETPLATRLELDFWESGRAERAELIILDDDISGLGRLIYPGYRFDGPLFADGDASLMPVVGMKTRPQTVFRRLP